MLLHVTLEVCLTADMLATLHARYAGLGGPRNISRGGRWNNDVRYWRRPLTESTLASIKG